MVEYRSLAISYRIELDFHAANNEGAGGTNVMEPRRITVGDKEYDGISGEMIRRGILENFVRLCRDGGGKLHSRCEGLVPDRGREDLKSWILKNAASMPKKKRKSKEIPVLDPQHYPEITHNLLGNCVLCDVGGFLIALEEADNALGVLKRDSCFEAGWLISEHPAIVDYTQHSAYDPDPEKHNLFVQNMRVGIYGGVFRIDLDRIGRNDWWWLNPKTDDNQKGFDVYSITLEDRKKRACLLLKAIKEWLLSPSFAKQAGWLQHQSGLLEGSIILSKDGPAPFASPIKFELEDGRPTIKKNDNYRKLLEEIAKPESSYEKLDFNTPAELIDKMDAILKKCEGNKD
jgi:CRISPR-associated autoregulator DevR family